MLKEASKNDGEANQMSEIKRYAVKQVREDEGGYVIVDVAEHPQGEWVRWEDVQELLALNQEEYDESLDGPYGTGPRHGE